MALISCPKSLYILVLFSPEGDMSISCPGIDSLLFSDEGFYD